MFTATVMGFFEGEIAKAVVLHCFCPSSSAAEGIPDRRNFSHYSGDGGAGCEVARLVSGHLQGVGLGRALGIILGTIGTVRILVWQKSFGTYGTQAPVLALTIFCALIGVVAFGTIAGSMLP